MTIKFNQSHQNIFFLNKHTDSLNYRISRDVVVEMHAFDILKKVFSTPSGKQIGFILNVKCFIIICMLFYEYYKSKFEGILTDYKI